jgi:3-deoxy-D-manno-octulosonate 8-phosphate phosphatase (KDO 8-P phosphatase)
VTIARAGLQIRMTLADRARKIELLLLDVDGVLTDGTLHYSDDGVETKRFHVRDGSGLKLWQFAGKRIAVISGRRSRAVANRCAELGIEIVKQGAGADKRPAFAEVLAETGLAPERICAVGDDWPDLPLFERCGLAIAPADASRDAIARADYITTVPGGHGAVRDAIEWLLGLTGQWEAATAMYRPNGSES